MVLFVLIELINVIALERLIFVPRCYWPCSEIVSHDDRFFLASAFRSALMCGFWCLRQHIMMHVVVGPNRPEISRGDNHSLPLSILLILIIVITPINIFKTPLKLIFNSLVLLLVSKLIVIIKTLLVLNFISLVRFSSKRQLRNIETILPETASSSLYAYAVEVMDLLSTSVVGVGDVWDALALDPWVRVYSDSLLFGEVLPLNYGVYFVLDFLLPEIKGDFPIV